MKIDLRKMETNRKQLLAVVMVVLIVFSAGCAGWGEDGPYDPAAVDDSEPDSDEGASDSISGPADDPDVDSNSDSSPDSASGSDSGPDSSPDGDRSESSDSNGADSGNDDTDDPENGNESAPESDENSEDESDGDRRAGDSDSDGTNGSEASDDNTGDESGGEQEPEDESDRETLELTVVDADGEPIEGARIEYVGEPGPDGSNTEGVGGTDRHGRVDLLVWDDMTYTLTAEYDGVKTGPIEVEIDGYTATEIVIEGVGSGGSNGDGESDEETSTVTITVTDRETGEPIEGAEIAGYHEDDSQGGEVTDTFGAATDEDGVATAEARHLTYRIDIFADGYDVGITAIDVDGDVEFDYALSPESDSEPDP